MEKRNIVGELTEPFRGHPKYKDIVRDAAALLPYHSEDSISKILKARFGIKELLELKLGWEIEYTCNPDTLDPETINQITNVARLPVTRAVALMPDAHPGYAMPIGGVADLSGAMSPSLVGNDIGCSMRLTIFHQHPDVIQLHVPAIFEIIKESTIFGIGKTNLDVDPDQWSIFDSFRWGHSFLKNLKSMAIGQFGTSGSGNHFVELVIGQNLTNDPGLPSVFAGLLSHSGSRGLGQAIAKEYMERAKLYTKQIANVPAGYEWLQEASEDGDNYWNAMTLAKDYAINNHRYIHKKITECIAKELNIMTLGSYECTHNYAGIARTSYDRNIIRHRKGAIDASINRIGIIPGSMGTASYVVRGCGNENKLLSASHGAGRRFSRRQAIIQANPEEIKRFMDERGILYSSLPLDESPFAYKDIEEVIKCQMDLKMIIPIAHMTPIAVVMDGA